MRSIIDIQKDYGKRLDSFMNKFGLTNADMAILINASSQNIHAIIDGSVGLNLKKMISIGDVFNLEYYNFANPKIAYPEIEDLPERTRKVIARRKIIKANSSPRDTSNSLAKELDRIIHDGTLNIPLTSHHIHALMSPSVKDKKTTEITSHLRRSPRNKKVFCLTVEFANNKLFVHNDYADKYEKMNIVEITKLMMEYENKLKK